MAKYSDIKGFTVQTLSEDPITSTPTSGVWASGGNLNTGRYITTGCAYGYQRGSTLALCVGGRTPPENYQALNEKYDGTSWTEVGDLSTRGRDQLSGFGTTTSAIAAGGYAGNDPPRRECESWDGSSWTEVGDLNSQTYGSAAAGVSNTSGLVFSGAPTPSDPNAVKTESWDGSSWTEVGDLNSGAPQPAGCGIQTAALSINGESDEGVESWNGSAWTEIADPNNTDRRGAVAAGSYTDAVVYGGGNPSRITKTETYNGTSWTEIADMGTASQYSGGGGQSNGFAINYGGSTPSNPTNSAATEEFQIAPVTAAIKTEGQLFFNSTSNAFKETITDFPGGTWASNTAMPTATTERWGTGTSNSNAMIGSPPGAAMEWNGSSWTNGGTVNDTFSSRGATGSITLALIWGGDGTPARVDTEQYNGSAWTEVNDLNNGGGQVTCGPTGTYTDTITAGRGTSNWQTNSESWNGSTWTETADLNTARRACGAGGASSTNSLVAGGNVPPNNATDVTESWNGTSWTETGDLNTARFAVTGFGNVSTAVGITGGSSYPASPPYNTKTEFFNGTTWTEVNDLTNGRYHNKGGGSGASALTMGGYLASPAGGQSTENLIWEANLANKTITAS